MLTHCGLHTPYRDRDLWTNVDFSLTYWGRVRDICVSKLTITGSDNGLSPDQRQAIIWTNAGLLLIGSLGTNFSEILIEIQTFSFMKMDLKVSSAKWRPFCLGLSVLMRLHGTHMKATAQQPYKLLFCMNQLMKIRLLKLLPHLPGVIELNESFSIAYCIIQDILVLLPVCINVYVWLGPARVEFQGSFWVWARPMREGVT